MNLSATPVARPDPLVYASRLEKAMNRAIEQGNEVVQDRLLDQLQGGPNNASVLADRTLGERREQTARLLEGADRLMLVDTFNRDAAHALAEAQRVAQERLESVQKQMEQMHGAGEAFKHPAPR